MDEITFPITITMQQLLRHNAMMDEIARLRAQVEALTADAVIRANRQAILIEAMKRIELNATDSHVMRIAAGALNAIGETKP